MSLPHGSFVYPHTKLGVRVSSNLVKIIGVIAWATKRKLQYFGIIVAVIILFVVVPFYMFIYEAPTCFDNLKNGGEQGIDCGGSCRLLCTTQIAKPVSRWDPRVFEVTPGNYSVIAYLENPNVNGTVTIAPYTFKLYDKENTLVYERSGTTFIPKGETFAIFEGDIQTGERVPTRATFDFNGLLVWEREVTPLPDISVINKALSGEDSSPRVDATVKNDSRSRVSNLELVAIVYDGSGNAIGVSRTFIDNLEKGETKQIVFTWPRPFQTKGEVCEAPVDVVLVIDRSGSMDDLGATPPQPLTDVKQAAISFVNQLGEEDRVALATFANDATRPIDFELASDFGAVRKAIDAVSILGGEVQNTNIADGLLVAWEELLSARHRVDAGKVVVMLTDGVATRPLNSRDERYPENYALQIANQTKLEGIGLFSIGLGKEVNVNFLKSLASSSDEAYFAPTTKDLASIYKQIATKICKKKPAVIEVLHKIYPPSYVVQ